MSAPSTSHRSAPSRPPVGRAAGAVGAGLVVAALVTVLRATHVLEGWPAAAFAALLLLAIPTARELARRVFINGALAVGWCVVTWWVVVSPDGIGRVTVALALAAGALTGWTLLASTPSRARSLVPRARIVDLVALGALVWIPLRMRARMFVANPHDALAMAMGGYDNIGHFDMVHILRTHGATQDRLAPPGPGDRWSYDTYPQSFHAVTASIIELFHSALPGTPSVELMRYVQGTAMTEAAVVALLVVGICGLPRVRRSTAVALPVVAFVVAVLLIGPGSLMIVDGYHNFFFGCVVVALVAVAGLQIPRPTSALHLAVIGGLLVAVAHAWLPLLALAAPAAVIIVWPSSRRRWRSSRRNWIVVVVVLVATALGVIRAAVILRSLLSTASGVLSIGSQFATPPVGLVVLAAAGATACCLLVGGRRGSSRVIAMAAVPVAGGLTLAAIAHSELSSTGELGYYFSKFVYAEYIVSLVILAIVLGTVFAGMRRNTSVRTRIRQLAGSALLAAALFQAFGPGARATMPTELATYGGMPVIDHLIAAGDYMAEHSEVPITYVSMSDDQFGDPIRASFWAMTLAGKNTWSTYPATAALSAGAAGGDAGLIAAIPTILDVSPDAQVLVTPGQLDAARAGLAPAQAERVVTW